MTRAVNFWLFVSGSPHSRGWRAAALPTSPLVKGRSKKLWRIFDSILIGVPQVCHCVARKAIFPRHDGIGSFGPVNDLIIFFLLL